MRAALKTGGPFVGFQFVPQDLGTRFKMLSGIFPSILLLTGATLGERNIEPENNCID